MGREWASVPSRDKRESSPVFANELTVCSASLDTSPRTDILLFHIFLPPVLFGNRGTNVIRRDMKLEEGAARPRLLWIVLLALALRFAVGLLLLPDRLDPRRDHTAFDFELGKVAASVAAGRGFSDPYYSRGAPPEGSDPSEIYYYQHTGPTAMEPPVFVSLLLGFLCSSGSTRRLPRLSPSS